LEIFKKQIHAVVYISGASPVNALNWPVNFCCPLDWVSDFSETRSRIEHIWGPHPHKACNVFLETSVLTESALCGVVLLQQIRRMVPKIAIHYNYTINKVVKNSKNILIHLKLLYLSGYSDGIMTGRPGFDSQQRQDIFLFFTASRQL
jgi:hypothetical protein